MSRTDLHFRRAWEESPRRGGPRARPRRHDARALALPARPALRGAADSPPGAGEAPSRLSLGARPAIADRGGSAGWRGAALRRHRRIQATPGTETAGAGDGSRHGVGDSRDRGTHSRTLDSHGGEGERARAGMVPLDAPEGERPRCGGDRAPGRSKCELGLSPAFVGARDPRRDRGAGSAGRDRSAAGDAVPRSDGAAAAPRRDPRGGGECAARLHDARDRRNLRGVAGRGAERPDADRREPEALSPKPPRDGGGVAGRAGRGRGVLAGRRDRALAPPPGAPAIPRELRHGSRGGSRADRDHSGRDTARDRRIRTMHRQGESRC